MCRRCAGRRGLGDRRRRRRDLDRPARRGRPADLRVLPPGDGRSGQGVPGAARCGRPRLAMVGVVARSIGAMRNRPPSRSDVMTEATRRAVEVVGVRQGVQRRHDAAGRRARRCRPHRRGGRVRQPHRSVGMRKVDAAAPDRQPHRADARADPRSTASPPPRPASTRTTGWPSSRPGCSSGAAW